MGATTLDEYRKPWKGRGAERRFQPVLVAEPTVEETIEILKGLREKYEAHHQVKFTDRLWKRLRIFLNVMCQTVSCLIKQPDLIDEAGSRVRMATRHRLM